MSDIITYIRRIIKSPSNAVISDNLIIDYINRFWIIDVDARIQLFDLKTKYSFLTTPGVDEYNMPLYSVQIQPGSQTIGMYPVYQGFLEPAYANGVRMSFHTEKGYFFNMYPNIVQNMYQVETGIESAGPYSFIFPISPNNISQTNPPISLNNTVPLNPPIQSLLRGHVDMAGIIATGVNIDPPVGTTINLLIPTTSINSAVYITSTNAYGENVVVADSGQFLSGNVNYGLLMQPGKAPYGNLALPNGYVTSYPITNITQASQAVITANNDYSVGEFILITNVSGMTELNGNTYQVVAANATTVTLNVDSTGFTAYISGGTISSIRNVINYLTGEVINLFFPSAIPNGVNINASCYFFQSGLPRSVLFYNNVLTLRVPPAYQYRIELDAYLSPAAFLNTESAIPFGYMSEYIARGAARKILSDTGDIEQFQFYEPLFKEQEMLVWKRSQRQWTSTRTQTIYSQGLNQGGSGFNNNGSNF